MCEMCEANQAHYGLRSEGWQRWCATCATDGGGCAVEKAVYLKVPKAAASRQAAVLPDQSAQPDSAPTLTPHPPSSPRAATPNGRRRSSVGRMEWMCSICHQVMCAPCVTHCGHKFDVHCLQRWMNQPRRQGSDGISPRTHAPCPLCNSPLQKTRPPPLDTALQAEIFKACPEAQRRARGHAGLHTLLGHSGRLRCLCLRSCPPLPPGETTHGRFDGGSVLFSGCEDGEVWAWALDDREDGAAHGRGICLGKHTSWVTCLALTEDGETLVSGSGDTTLQVWDVPRQGSSIIGGAPRRRHVLHGHAGWVLALSVQGAATALSAGADQSLRLWDLSGGSCVAILAGASANNLGAILRCPPPVSIETPTSGEDVSETACALAGSSPKTSQTLSLWRLPYPAATPPRAAATRRGAATPAKCDVAAQLGRSKFCMCIALSHDGGWLAAGFADTCVRVFDVRPGPAGAVASTEPTSLLYGHNGAVACLAWWEAMAQTGESGGGGGGGGAWRLLSGSRDADLRVWDPTPGGGARHRDAVLRGHTAPVNCVATCAARGWVASGSDDCTVRVWGMDNLECLAVVRAHTEFVVAIALRGPLLCTASADRSARVFHITLP
jgi:WD40 repeat protein